MNRRKAESASDVESFGSDELMKKHLKSSRVAITFVGAVCLICAMIFICVPFPLPTTVFAIANSVPFPLLESAVTFKANIDLSGCLLELPEEHFHGPHIVVPPSGSVTLVCCQTSKGVLNIAVHPSWCPLGAGRFLDMVKSKFFSSHVPLFRSLKGFLVQFGLAGDPAVQTIFDRKGNLQDDPPWLPLGPSGRVVNGVPRYQKGYLGYAGAGKDSRGTQLIMALGTNERLGGLVIFNIHVS